MGEYEGIDKCKIPRPDEPLCYYAIMQYCKDHSIRLTEAMEFEELVFKNFRKINGQEEREAIDDKSKEYSLRVSRKAYNNGLTTMGQVTFSICISAICRFMEIKLN